MNKKTKKQSEMMTRFLKALLREVRQRCTVRGHGKLIKEKLKKGCVRDPNFIYTKLVYSLLF